MSLVNYSKKSSRSNWIDMRRRASMMYVVLGFLCFAFLMIILAACKTAVEEDELMHMHPPDDDDGVTIRKDDDPDGQYQR